MPTVRIYFQGVAVHLIGAVPGVPCRVVLPDATASYLYPTKGPDGMEEVHVLDRHFTSIRWQIPGGEDTMPIFRQYFTPGNPVTGQDFKLDPSMAMLYHLDNWVPNLQLSSEVVYSGRTAAYFDIFYGTLACHELVVGGPLFTSLTIEMQDNPFLITVPFHYASFDFQPDPPTPKPWPLPANDITVANSGEGCAESRYDFALNFLVTRGGIPSGLKDLPGENPTGQTKAARAFAPFDRKAMPSRVLDSLSAACSPSSFPKPGG